MNDTFSEINGINNINSNSIYPELGSPPMGPYVSPLPPEQLLNRNIYTTLTCYNCLSVLLVRKDWNFIRCGECQKINRIPKAQITENYNNNSYYQEDNDLIGDIPYLYGLVNCPFCATENKIRKEAKRVTCYNCGNNFTVNGYANDKIKRLSEYEKNKYPNYFIRYKEYIPIYYPHECNCKINTQNFLLNQILQNIKDIKKPSIPYPLLFNDPFGFRYRELFGDYHYNKRYDNNNDNYLVKSMDFQINKKKKENESDGFKITIRKKNKDKKNDLGNKMTKSAVFEKVFFTHKLKDDNKYNNI